MNVLTCMLMVVIGAGVSAVIVMNHLEKVINQKHILAEKQTALLGLMIQWLKGKQNGKRLGSYFRNRGINIIAIYGMGEVGERLLVDLKAEGFCVKYAIDNYVTNAKIDVSILTLQDELPVVDAIVVTAITFFQEIETALKEKVTCPIISLEEIVFEINRMEQ